MIDAEISMPTLSSSPWIRWYPHKGFSLDKPPHQQLCLLGDGSFRVHPMGLSPFPPDELSMPAPERIRSHKR
jgi:hypothetical protein